MLPARFQVERGGIWGTNTLKQANQLITGAIAKGGELALKPLSVDVVDAGGHLIAFQRQDGASFGRL